MANPMEVEATHGEVVIPIDKEEARTLTDTIKGRTEELWFMLLEAYERGAHTALGYSSWGKYFEAEFGQNRSRGYQLVDAGKVVKAIEGQSTIVDRPTESQARELAAIAKESPEEAAMLWGELLEEHGNDLTAKDVKQAAKEMSEFKQRLAALPEQTRTVLEQADENFDKHRNLLRNSNQMNHLARIAEKRGDEIAASVAEKALTEEGSNVFAAYDQLKKERGEEIDVLTGSQEVSWIPTRNGEEVEAQELTVERVRKVFVEYEVEWSDGTANRVKRKTLEQKGFKRCGTCGHGMVKKGDSK